MIGILLGLVATVVTVVWQRYSDQRKKSLPSKNKLTSIALDVLVAARKSSTTHGLTEKELYKQIVEAWNDDSPDGNFNPEDYHKVLRSYTNDALNRLSHPKHRELPPLVEFGDGVYQVTQDGLDEFERLPVDADERVEMLNQLLNGTRTRRGEPPATSSGQAAAPAPQGTSGCLRVPGFLSGCMGGDRVLEQVRSLPRFGRNAPRQAGFRTDSARPPADPHRS